MTDRGEPIRGGPMTLQAPDSDVRPVAAATGRGPAVRRGRSMALLAVYTAATALGALLLFLVQPIVGKLVLPLLGGSPAVWNTCMLFFQGMLLLGYLYAHLSSRLLDVRRQAAVHGALLVAAGLLLPVSVGGAAPQGGESPIPWLLQLLMGSVGLPFLVLSGTGPMLQRWFARSDHPAHADPYRLYAASNLGSLVALLAYPALLEPTLRLREQSAAWAGGYLLLVLAVGACAALGWPSRLGTAAPTEEPEGATVTAHDRAAWVALSLVPSSLLFGVTTYLTTDLAPMPLLWVLPLALYLLSFTLVFAPRPPVPHGWMLRAQPALLVAATLLMAGSAMHRPAIALPVHLAALFVTAMVCHGELARSRPPASRLTEFYLWVSVGGALGGAFNVLLAPLLFTGTWEYPLMLVLACLARPWPASALRAHLRTLPRAVAMVAALLLLTGEAGRALPVPVVVLAAGVTLHLLTVGLGWRPLWLAAALGVVVLARVTSGREGGGEVVWAERTFYGHFAVERDPGDGGYHVLTHGSTLHGAQSLDPARRGEPLTYYGRSGPLGEVFATLGIASEAHRVGVVGLGAGTTLAYARAGERWTVYELDPGIVRIARDPRLFTYLRDSPVMPRVVLGDARLSLARDHGETFDLLVLDAFSSDAVPVHLLTVEALDTYLARLAPRGRIALHISNRYLDLEPVVAALARERGLAARVGTGSANRTWPYRSHSTWVVLARQASDLAALTEATGWRTPRVRPGLAPWTDDFSSILSVLAW